jgi:hypothetical protein
MLELLNNAAFWGSLLVFAVGLFGIFASRASNQAVTIQTQGKTLSDAFDEIAELRKDFRDLNKRYQVTWGYMIALVEGYHQHNLLPPEPPEELQTDPELMRLINSIKKRQAK